MAELPLITSPAVQNYCDAYSNKPQSFMQDISDNTASTVGKTKMLSGQFLGQYLRMMSMILRPKTILELGTFTGYGTICLMEGLSPDSKIVTIEKDPAHAKIAEEHLSEWKTNNVEMHIGDAFEILDTLEEKWDLVFIDAAKRQYIKYYEKILPLVNQGGVILADNVLWKGIVATENKDRLGEGLHAFNEHVFHDSRVDNMILPLDDGINFIIKK